jgi:glycosyltransferase involved in cell wall biosynthesis
MDFERVCVVIPCHNEEKTIGKVIRKINELDTKIQIIVVDNNSTDLTSEAAAILGTIVIRENRIGKGLAFRRGVLNLSPKIDYIVMVDGDDTYDLKNLKEDLLLMSQQNADLVVGRRVSTKDSSDNKVKPFKQGHKLGNKIFSLLNKKLNNSGISDALSGYRIMSRRFLDSFLSTSSGFEIEAELNAFATFIDANVLNTEIEYSGREVGSQSKLSTYRDGFRIFLMNFRFLKIYHPKKMFNFLSALNLLAGLALGFKPVSQFLDFGKVEKFPSLIVSVGFLAISVQLWIAGSILDQIRITQLNQSKILYGQPGK